MKNIVLTGYMGSGKSTVGKAIAKELSFHYIDVDTIINDRCGMSIEQIFDRFGEEYFRDLETEVIDDISKNKFSVIATGGGAVLREKNIDLLRKNGYIFFLDTPLEIIENRMSLLAGRPLLMGKSPVQVRKHFNQRRPFYDNYDFRIDTANKKISEVTAEIVSIYQSNTSQLSK